MFERLRDWISMKFNLIYVDFTKRNFGQFIAEIWLKTTDIRSIEKLDVEHERRRQG